MAGPSTPRQARSKLTLERIVGTARELWTERGNDGFTLDEVSERSGVSIGSIYNRFAGKQDLVEHLHEQGVEAMVDDVRARMTAPGIAHDLPGRVDWLVRVVGSLLSDHAAVLRPSMVAALRNERIAAMGKRGHAVMVEHWAERLREVGDEIAAPDVEEAISWSFTVAYSVLARYLGLGSSAESAYEGDWDASLRQLTLTVVGYLSYQREESS
ncbi:TetR/AcrR family transcriptional regulator [Amycolatopsis acidicola]|uniref:TetR/AcrR family transcriptional regulator n=1 Tax=Amycolatopsis acidicola TaxID=2596893 RepID=A0A5N0V2Q0_9PSEU|nr:TetR/AcrR family transcriptional regulator [Amycolatopsis acidicola]KAA9160709.1 TetR/AcrR family transcriptional regulator [Amycolatopsis acidicola]